MVSTIPLVSFVITLLLASAVSIQGVQVHDTDGNAVTTTDQYFIQPATGGSLYPGRYSSNPSCLLGIYQLVVGALGDPVSFAFTWPDSKKTIVDTYSDVTIEFNTTVEGCNGYSKYWGVDVSPSDPKKPKIIAGAEPTRTNSWFQIRTAGENIYELATRSGTVGLFKYRSLPPFGIYIDGQLFLTNETSNTLFVKFIKKVDLDATRTEKLGLRMFPFY